MRRVAVSLIDLAINLAEKVLHAIFYLLGWRFVCMIGKIAGDLIYLVKKGKREMVRQELKSLLNNPDDGRIGCITRKSFENYYMRQIETVFFGSLDEKTIREMMDVEGIENLDAALSKGKGVILLLSHFGSFLLPLPFLGYEGYKVNQVTGRQRHVSAVAERLWLWRKQEAERLPVNFIQVGKFLRPIYKALSENEIVAIAFDGRDGSDYKPVRFLNRRALISPGPINLSLKTGAVIVPTFMVRKEDLSHALILCEPFELVKTGSAENDILANLERYTRIFADFILRYPCHYGMIFQIMRSEGEVGKAVPFFDDQMKGVLN